MTDEQIEKAIKLAISDLSYCAQKQIIDYIDRLKTENAILKKNADEAFQQGLNENRNLIEPEIRKETAKEILQILFEEAMQYGKTTDSIKHMAKRYGIEVN